MSEFLLKDVAPGRPHASPTVRKLARELGVTLSRVVGSARNGRIVVQDLYLFVQKVMAGQATIATIANTADSANKDERLSGLLPWPQVDFSAFGEIERRAVPRIRKISAANLHRNWMMIPHVTNHQDVDITDLEAFRVRLNNERATAGAKVTLLALLMKASVFALEKFPEINASLDAEELVLKRYFHVGFAVDTPRGLMVPVIRDVDRKGILAIAGEMAALSAKAREGKLSGQDMSGGCFTLSSLGGIGGTYFTPIINAAQVAILGVGKSTTRACWNEPLGTVVPRLVLPLSLSWDHRVIDGAMAGRFNAYLADMLTDYRRLLL